MRRPPAQWWAVLCRPRLLVADAGTEQDFLIAMETTDFQNNRGQMAMLNSQKQDRCNCHHEWRGQRQSGRSDSQRTREVVDTAPHPKGHDRWAANETIAQSIQPKQGGWTQPQE